MFFLASKAIWALAVPSNGLTGLALLGTLLARTTRFRRVGATLAALAIVLLAGIGASPLGSWILQPLEDRFPPYVDDGTPVAGVVVLGGGIYPDVSMARGQLALAEEAERYIAMADLARRFPAAKVVFTGGSGALVADETAEADVIKRYEGFLGLPPGRVLYENRSRITWENATETRKLVSPAAGERWLLVTSAWHMPRAVGCFRQAGFDITAYPVDYLTAGSADPAPLRPTVAGGLGRFDLGAKEWIGLVLYRLSGRTASLFPSPSSAEIAIR